MRSLLGEFRFGAAAFSFDDHALASRFKRAYGLRETDGRSSGVWFETRRDGAGFYSLASSNGENARGGLEHVLGSIDESLDKMIRMQVDERTCSLHASSSAVLGSAVACAGVSGSGKTTLALALAAVGDGLIGDEYAFLDLDTGMLEHEAHPVQVKVDCGTAAEENAVGSGLGMVSRWGVSTVAKSPADAGARFLPGSHRLKMIVFPRFDSSANGASLFKVPIAALPQMLLTSAVGGGGRVQLFKAMTRLASKGGVGFCEARYNDADEAAKAIVSLLGRRGSLHLKKEAP